MTTNIQGMVPFAAIRKRLGITQAAIAQVLDVTQGMVSFYENGQTVPPKIATMLIAYAAEHGLHISYDHVYGAADLPPEPAAELPLQPVSDNDTQRAAA